MMPMPEARAEAQRVAEHPGIHAYCATQGAPMLLDAIEQYLAEEVRAASVQRANLQVMAGATVGLSIICQTLLETGDEVLLPSPFWPLIRGIISSRGAVPVEVPVFTHIGEAGFDLERELESRITPRTVALYVNSPHNPTGVVLSEHDQAVFARVAIRHNLWVISDEAYEEIYFGARPVPFWARNELEDRVIVAHTFSKCFAMAGARVAFVHGPEPVMQAIRAMQTFHMFCAPHPMQIAVAKGLRNRHHWLAELRETYAASAREASAALQVPCPAGGTFLFFDARRAMRQGENLHDLLVRCLDAGVLVTPGTAAGRDYDTHIRLCFTAVPPEELTVALGLLQSVLV